MGTEAPTAVLIPVTCAFKRGPCPKCGRLGRRKRTLIRRVRTVAYKAIAFLEITYGEYTARWGCSATFRNTPEGVFSRARYEDKVRELVLNRQLRDGMSVERALESLRREVLARLLKLNHERYAVEVAQGLHDKGKKPKRPSSPSVKSSRSPKSSPAPPQPLR